MLVRCRFLLWVFINDLTSIIVSVASQGITTVNPEGLTSAMGEHARALQARLNDAGMKCNLLSKDEYKPAMFEKLIWICTYMLVGTANECATVGDAGKDCLDFLKSVEAFDLGRAQPHILTLS